MNYHKRKEQRPFEKLIPKDSSVDLRLDKSDMSNQNLIKSICNKWKISVDNFKILQL